jgi:tRNA dimethylallyltransferase
MDFGLHTKTLLVVAGPTAIGKTAFAIELAKRYYTEIVSADSRQFYREMAIGTAKPSLTELSDAKHHFINSHSIFDTFTAGDYEKEALNLLNQLFIEHDLVVLVGGSGLFIKAVCEGFDEFPDIAPAIRNKLNEEFVANGLAPLQERLKQTDPSYFNTVDCNNPQRVIRALEVIESTGIPYSSFRKANAKERPFNIIKLGLNLSREHLYQRINQRVDNMMTDGLLEEVKQLLPYQHLNPLNTVGYTELFDFLAGKQTLEEAISLIKQNTRRFAKRQLTWFRKDEQIVWLKAEQPMIDFESWLNNQDIKIV